MELKLKKVTSENWTLKQNKFAVPLIKKLYEKIFGNISEENVKKGKKSLSDQIKDVELGLAIIDIDFEAELLALLWIEESEDKFDEKTYKSRIESIENATIKDIEEMREVYPDFFGSIMKSIMGVSQIYSQMTINQT